MKMDIARSLIELGCVKFSPSDPFTYASGLVGPIYCDNRILLSHPEVRKKIIHNFLTVIKDESLLFELVGGIATAGIPYAAFISDRLDLPMIYVRPKAKEHGSKNQVEGDFKRGQSVLLFEDLVNQGASLADAMKGVISSGLQCSVCMSIVDYQMEDSKKRLEELSLSLYSLTDFEHLLLAAFEMKLISTKERNLLIDWHDNPKEWSKLF
jgi:orotate phosphoribosyltransferase